MVHTWFIKKLLVQINKGGEEERDYNVVWILIETYSN